MLSERPSCYKGKQGDVKISSERPSLAIEIEEAGINRFQTCVGMNVEEMVALVISDLFVLSQYIRSYID